METIEKIYKFAYERNNSGIIIDTNVLLLLLIGQSNYTDVSSCELVKKYSKEDLELLVKIIKPFKKILITPKIVTEVSNLLHPRKNNEKVQQYFSYIINLLNDIEKSQEQHLEFKSWENKEISRISTFGFVDMDIYELSKKNNLAVLTDDEPFYSFSKKDIPIIYFSSIRYSNIIQ